MIRYCKIKHCIIGFDRPKICVPLVGRSAEEIIAQADQIRQSQRSSAIDMVELRGDYLDILPDYEVLDRLLAKVAEILPEKVLLFTIRSEAEGGEKLAFTTPTIYEINRHVIEKATADMVDIELFSGAEQAEEMIGIAKEKGVKIIMSNHDFQTTPDASTIVNRLRSMQDLGADVAKIAVMPENKMHVVNLLAATAMMIENATLSYIEPYASSACEMIAEILQYIEGKVKLRPIEADAMYAGIVIDTDNFLTKTGVRTFDAASYLRRSGADVVRVRKMFRSDMYTYRQLAEGVINSEIYMEHFAISTVDPKESDAPTVVAAKVANDLLNIEGIRASFVTTEKDGTVYMSARSVDDVNVQIIMEKMGGGGHANIAGAQFTNSTNELVLIQLKTLLDEMYREGDI